MAMSAVRFPVEAGWLSNNSILSHYDAVANTSSVHQSLPYISETRRSGFPVYLLTTIALAFVLFTTAEQKHNILSAVVDPILSFTASFRSLDGKKTLRGPRYVYPFGNFRHMFSESRALSYKWKKEYGHIYRIWTGLYSEVVISTPQDVAAFYSDSASHKKTLAVRSGWVVNSLLGVCVGFANGHDWKRNRKAMDALLANNVAVKHIARINDTASCFISSLPLTRVDGGSDDKTMVVKAANTFLPFTLNETTSIFFGEMSDVEKMQLWGLCTSFMAVVENTLLKGPFRWGLGYWMHSREEFQSAKEYLKTWEKWVETASESRKGQNDLPITKLWQEVEKGNLSKDELLQTLTESTVFNLEPTSHALLMTTLMVADDPKFQEELVAEFDSNRDDIPKYIGRKDTLLHFAFLEAMRVQPVLPFTLPEAASVDKELSGFKIPKGTSVVTSSFALNTNPEFWGPDATSFRPARFAFVTPVELQRNLSMFGFGARKCLGQFFADKQLRAVVFHLFDRYKVTCSDYSTFEKGFKEDKTEYIDRFALEFMLQKRERA